MNTSAASDQTGHVADPTPIRLRGPADVLGVVPTMLGFHPEDSVVLVCLQGPRNRSCLTMRADLPVRRDGPAVARDLVRRATAAGADAVIGVIYDDGDHGAHAPGKAPPASRPAPFVLPRAAFARQLARACAGAHLELVELLGVRGGRFRSYLCTQEECCPAAGTELPAGPTPAALHVRAVAVAAGSTVVANRAALAAGIAAPAPADAGPVCQLVESADAGNGAPDPTPGWGDADPVHLLRDLHVRYRNGTGRATAPECASLVRGLRDVHARDRVLAWGGGSDPASLLSVLGDVVRAVPPPHDAPVCTLLAWVAYQHGSGALAQCALDRALDTDPGYTLAVLLQHVLERGMPPSQLAAAFAGAPEPDAR